MNWLKYLSSTPFGEINLTVKDGQVQSIFKCNKAMQLYLGGRSMSGKVADVLVIGKGILGTEVSFDQLVEAVVSETEEVCYAIINRSGVSTIALSESGKEYIGGELLFPSADLAELYAKVGRQWSSMELLWPKNIHRGITSKLSFNPEFLKKIVEYGVVVNEGEELDAVFEFYTMLRDTISEAEVAQKVLEAAKREIEEA